ncbi:MULTISPECIES: RbsD/FucU family protein [unclassified Rathayibacter]|uniref:RbsD/FucU family protein n=1 Tax=unclassified Rathayibacter TaxID=2609250 RepID=UPI000CE8D2D3|nr:MULTISPECIES: RbsD/FucU family protein [unclassified Rathayibacter]PPF17174.1 RbsD or FucU transport [Rathayibacter sp. AY1A4]PPG75491.1 RbsD or FucU transport [Rathayibacter sp. AY1E5]PPH26947.1 RbsD or FucU transport [Rathayibacter sp. AY1C3]PPH57271.1 RbsD or FucU transport [Rathayibacter sp. AY1D7]PPI26802.1 RbsD or FucU transport [Rathayibacter sp. AY1B4]
MLTTTLLHPEILHALARAGHGSRVLIADGNYPVGTTLGPNSALVHLNLRPDMLTVDEIVDALLSAIVVEEATVMTPAPGIDVPAQVSFRRSLDGIPFTSLERHAFYAEARTPDVALTIASGDRRIYANLILTIGVRPADAS